MTDTTRYRGLVAWFTRNTVAANLLAFSIVVGGLLTIPFIKKEVFPELEPNIVTVTVPYPGATPAEVEQGVCMRIEEEVEGITGVDKVTSIANEGGGLVVIETLLEADMLQVLDDVKNRVDAITNFPEDIEEPVVQRMVLRKEVINVAIYGNTSERTLKTLGDRVRQELSTLPGITQVELHAVRPYEVSIEVSEEALRRWNLTFDAVVQAVRRGSLDLPAGAIKGDDEHTLLRVQGQAYRGREFEQLPVLTREDGTRITLGEIATVVDGFADDDLFARFDGEPGVLLKVFRVGNQDALAITDVVRQWVAGPGKAMMPAGVEMTTWRDESVILRSRISLLLRNALTGLCLVILILALFLKLRLAFWVTLGIPISFLGAVALMPTLGVSINLISLFAFIVVLGIVVDDAIVVGENIYEHHNRSESALEASLKGAKEVSVPVVFAVLTTVTAFLPMFNVPGVDAQIWRVIPLIVIPTLLFSLVESKLVLPAHLTFVKPRRAGHRPNIGVRVWERLQGAIQGALGWFIERVYQPSADFCLRWRYLTLAAAASTFLLTATLTWAGYVRFIFFPTVEGDNVVVSLTMPQGTPVEDTGAVMTDIEQAARRVAAAVDDEYGMTGRSVVEHMLTTVGDQPYAAEQARSGGDRADTTASGSHLAELNIQLLPSEEREVGSEEIKTRIREEVGLIPDAVELQFTTSLFTTGKDIDVELYHEDTEVLRAAAAELREELAEYAGVYDITDSFRLGKQELKLGILPQAEVLGLTQQDLARQVRQAFYGEEAQRIQRGRHDVKVMVRYPESGRRSLADLEDMRVRTDDGAEVPFHEVTRAELGRGYSSIRRSHRKRVIRVTAEVDETNPEASADEVNRTLATTVLPAMQERYNGLQFGFEGDQKQKAEVLEGLFYGFLFALFVMYALMAIPFKSYMQPLLIMTAIPFGFVGAVWGHVITGYDLSILSMFGLVALAGVVVNDSLVLVDWINRSRERHEKLLDAVRTAGARRFRPILLTSLTTFAGLTPLMLEKSVQARFLIPMGVSLAFGVIFSTVISLVIVPCLYLVLEDLKKAFAWLYGKPQPEGTDGQDSATPVPAP